MSMAIRTNAPSASLLLRRLIEDPALADTVQSLPVEALWRVIEHVGLEDSGEIVAVASDAQLLGVLDSDLWMRIRGGEDAEFNSERFPLWLEILLEAGEKALVARLSELPEELLVSAFYCHILVLNLDDLAEREAASEEDDVNLVDKALMDCLGHELDEFYIIARQDRGWDTLLTAILALYEHNPSLLNRILEKCCYASWEYVEENGGLYEVLSAEEMLASDAAADREDRRARMGYIAPSDAAAFLKLAAHRDVNESLRDPAPDPITRAYFREFETSSPVHKSNAAASNREAGVVSDRILSLLKQSGIFADPMDSLLLPPGEHPGASTEDGTRYHAVLKGLSQSDPQGHESRISQLIYLTNIIESAFGTSFAPIRPVEALKIVFQILDAGTAYVQARQSTFPPNSDIALCLEKISPITLFFVGFKNVSFEDAFISIEALKESLARYAAGNL